MLHREPFNLFLRCWNGNISINVIVSDILWRIHNNTEDFISESCVIDLTYRFGISPIYNIYEMGPRIRPCVTPNCICFKFECTFSSLILNNLSDMFAVRISTCLSSILFNLFINPLCHILPKAWAISRKSAE